MALRTARFWPEGRPQGRRLWQTGTLASLIFVSALGGCSGPIEAYRSLSGVNKNDPDPQTAPFSRNLAEGEAAPYPNLGSVPPPPTPTTNAAERQKLTQSLIAERSAPATPTGPQSLGPATPAKARPGLPPAAKTAASVAAPPDIQSSGAAAAVAADTSTPTKTALHSVPSGRRSPGEPPQPGPLDSTLQTPTIPSLPEPDAARPPPPAPVLPAVPRPVAVAEPPAAALADVAPQPAPPVPDMTPSTPPPAPPKAAPPPATITVATLDIPPGAAAPRGPDQAQIARVAALYKEKGGRVRVLAYAAAPATSGDPLASYHAALDRAQGVAKALSDSGIPADRIQTEATPAGGARAAGRVEIQLLP